MKNYPWKSSAFCVFVPHPEEVDDFCEMIEKRLAPDGIDTLFLLVRYEFEFQSHPECRGDHAISLADAKKILATCRACNIRLIPKINLLGHQETDEGGLLRAHPEFDETPDMESVEYCRSICPNHPDIFPFVCDLMDELIDAFEADGFHIGTDEVFLIGECERCKGRDKGEIFAEWVNKLAGHLRERGVTTYMWGDRLLDSFAIGYGPWDASQNGTHTALNLIDKDIIICDWHYHNWHHFPSAAIFAEAGLQVYLCTFNSKDNAKLFLDEVLANDKGNVIGVMETTWTPAKWMIEGLLGREISDSGDICFKEGTPHIVECYDWLFK